MRQRRAWKKWLRAGLLVSALASLGGAWGIVQAADSPKPSVKREQQRRAVEALLDQDVAWEVGDKRNVTLGEFITHVRERHGLSIRWDVGTFRALSGHSPLEDLDDARPSGSPPTSSSPGSASLSPADEPRVDPSSAYGGSTPASLDLSALAPPARSAALPPPSPLPAAAMVSTDDGKPHPVEETTAPNKSATKPAEDATGDPQPGAGREEASPDKTGTSEVLKTGEPSATTAPDPQPEPVEPKEELHSLFARAPVERASLGLETASVGETLQALLDAAAPTMMDMSGDLGVPMATRAFTLDYLIEGRSIVITTRMQANFRKETRVYSIAHLKPIPAEDLAQAITHSVHPWSWRSQAPELAARLAARWPKGSKLTLPTVKIDVNTGLQMVAEESADPTQAAAKAVESLDAETLASLGQFLAGSAVTMWETGLAAVEMVYHAEPPTGQIEVLPGMLVINQSQAAHREIADLLEQMTEAAKAGE